MNERVRIKGFIAALMLAFAALPAIAAPACDGVLAVDTMRAANAANAQKLLEQQGGSRILFKVDADALYETMVTDLRDEVSRHCTTIASRLPIRRCALGAVGRGGSRRRRRRRWADEADADRVAGRLVDQQIVKPAGNAAKQ